MYAENSIHTSRVPCIHAEMQGKRSKSGTVRFAVSTFDDPHDTEEPFFDDPVSIPIDGVLDLHTFSPKELPPLLDDYIEACREAGITDLRIIHGKGKGILRKRVRSLLEKNPHVAEISEAPLEAGGFGATLVKLKG
jgi:hypothetical protein